MPPTTVTVAPGLSSFLKSLKNTPVDSSIEHFIALLKRRQIRNSRPCAIATTQLLLRVVAEFKFRDVDKLLRRVREVGQRLIAAQPREMVVGNIVRRVLGLIREVAEDDAEVDTNAISDIGNSPVPLQSEFPRPTLASSMSTFSPLRYGSTSMDSSLHQSESMSDQGELPHRPPLLTSHTSYSVPNAPMVTSLFGLFSHPDSPSASSTPTGYNSPNGKGTLTAQNLERLSESTSSKANIKAEVQEGIKELMDELEQSDDLIAANALDHIHSNEIILTHSASTSVQKFLLAAAKKRKFTVVHAEAHPNDHHATHAMTLTGTKRDYDDDSDAEDRWKPLTAAGITVVMIPDSHVFAIMSRVNKVILATHTVLANGGLVAAAGARVIAKAAKVHQTPVVVVSGVYKLSPVYPFDIEELIEYGDAGNVVPYEDGDFVDKVDVDNPLYDYVPADLVDLYITNLGGHAPSYLYRIVADHYRVEDINL
ncbi:nagb/rpia/CoA transferase-like protein [Lepidopterella palustris CBS 459.81]|uniref:Translation initiation factor eIF2B subunit beta n=1 Tax=Lepidopterella palustris CBS 459.81 TaxID=1314670 RepID=A0A8E2EDD9_9PEZI|nr:nagb/rpia/CoA transferase-like protein [Lepidopterella palustris CBS 459.81]